MERVRLMNHSGEMDGEYRHGGSFGSGDFSRYSLVDLKKMDVEMQRDVCCTKLWWW